MFGNCKLTGWRWKCDQKSAGSLPASSREVKSRSKKDEKGEGSRFKGRRKSESMASAYSWGSGYSKKEPENVFCFDITRALTRG